MHCSCWFSDCVWFDRFAGCLTILWVQRIVGVVLDGLLGLDVAGLRCIGFSVVCFGCVFVCLI